MVMQFFSTMFIVGMQKAEVGMNPISQPSTAYSRLVKHHVVQGKQKRQQNRG